MQQNQVMDGKINEAYEYYTALPVYMRVKIRDLYLEKFESNEHYFYRRLKAGKFSKLEFDFIKREAEKIVNEK